MKILVVVPDLNLGGVTSSARNFCRECAKQGDKVNILVMNNVMANILDVNQILLSGLSQYWNLGIEDLRNYSLLKQLSVTPIAILKKILNKYGLWIPLIFRRKLPDMYDIVVAYRQCAPCYYYALHCVNATKRLAMLHGDLNFMGDISSWSFMLQDFDKVACVSNAVSIGFKNHFKSISNKFTTIYNMYDIDSMNKLKQEKNLFMLNSSKFNIISVCRHENGHKKVNRIVEACAIFIKRGYCDFHWYIVGDGPDLDNNTQLARVLGVAQYITFCGALENPFSLFGKCDLTVLTSATEAYGMCLKESLILGVPVVAMEYPALSEVIEDGINGLICKQSIEDLCDKILYLANNRYVLFKMKEYISHHNHSNDMAYQQFLNCLN